jgi:hypothetical protein
MPAPRLPLEERFWMKVEKTRRCWKWIGATNHKGYGHIAAGTGAGKVIKAHRLAWMLANGPIPEGLFVLHRCDNPSCVRAEPDGKGHLFLGTHGDNMADAIAKGRIAPGGPMVRGHGFSRGSNNGHARLTEAQVIEIRAAYVKGKSEELAAAYGVKANTIRAIARRRFWRHV